MVRSSLAAILACVLFIPPTGVVAYDPPAASLVAPSVVASAPALEVSVDAEPAKQLGKWGSPIDVAAETPEGKFVAVKIVLPTPSEPNYSIETKVEFIAPDGATWDKYDCADGREFIVTGTPGKYAVKVTVSLYETITVFVRNPEFPDDITKGKLVDRRFLVTNGGENYTKDFAIVGTTPPPTPPKPPTPPVPDVTAGERDVYLVHDERLDDMDWQILANGLRTGEPAKYLTDRKHKVTIVDVNDRDTTGAKFWPLTKFATLIDPAKRTLIIVDRKTQAVVAFAVITPKTTAANVVDAIRKAGG